MEIQKEVVQSYSEPENIHVIWLDSNDNKLKIYENGSWQSLDEDNKYYVDAPTLYRHCQALANIGELTVIGRVLNEYYENEEYTPDLEHYNDIMYVIKTVLEIKKQFDLGKCIYYFNVEQVDDIFTGTPTRLSTLLLKEDYLTCSYVCSNEDKQMEYITNMSAGTINKKEFLKTDFEELYLNAHTEEGLKTIPEEYKFNSFVIKFNNGPVFYLGWSFYDSPTFIISYD